MSFEPLPLLPSKRASASPAPAPAGWPVLRLGFRPFYLAAAAFAALAMPVWLAVYAGGLALPMVLPPVWWHAHEMLFGFAAAVIVGFLLTAGKAWTGLATPRGAGLGALVLLWLAARVTAFTGPHAVYAVLDVALLPLVAAVLLDRLLRAGNRRNLPVAAILFGLAAANAAFHLAVLGVLPWAPASALHAGLALIVMIECVIAGRIVPAFTMGAMPGLRLAPRPRLAAATLASTALALAAWVAVPGEPLTGAALALAAVLHLVRQWQWQPWLTRRRPILWILHAGYAWLPVGLALLAAAQFGWAAGTVGLHALAVGATGGLIIGMITRTARGHTGRALQVTGLEVAAYALVMAAAALRVLLPLVAPQWMLPSVVAAGVAWSLAFAIYLVVYTPWLLRAREDGKDG